MSWACVIVRYGNSTNTCVHNFKLSCGQEGGRDRFEFKHPMKMYQIIFRIFPLNVLLSCKMYTVTIVRVFL